MSERLASPAATRPLWRNRDFMLLWSGQVVSTVGMRVTTLAYPLLVLALTGSPFQAGLVGFAQTLPFLVLYLPAGALVDRWDRKRVMLAADGVRVVLLGLVVLALAVDRVSVAALLVVVFLDGACFVFFQLAESAALPHIVPGPQLPTALAQNQARELGADLAGRPLGGALFAVGHTLPFVFDLFSYVLGFLTMLFVRPGLQERRAEEPRRGLLTDIAEGLAWLWRQHLLRSLVALTGAVNLVLASLTLVLIVRAQQLGASASLIGMMLALPGGAAIAGAFAAPWLQRRLTPRLVVLGSLWLWAGGMVALVWLPSPLALGAVVAVTALPEPAFNVVLTSYRYALAPDRLQARTVGVARLIIWGAIPLGSLAAGSLLQALGARGTLVTYAVFMIALAALATSVRTIRRAPRFEEISRPE
ncbi:MFS transporter [Streptomyces yerevanensis]|uniref:MFS transporter n=1 Tax=Streptomyces yerevanensis TaxID=66378 RepID=UPI000524AE6D|nr:MFS transporter [Streptomyces yerevanensis]